MCIFFADAKVAETLELRIFDPDLKLSKGQILALLKKADLEGHGFRKEVGKKLAHMPGTDQNVLRTYGLLISTTLNPPISDLWYHYLG